MREKREFKRNGEKDVIRIEHKEAVVKPTKPPP